MSDTSSSRDRGAPRTGNALLDRIELQLAATGKSATAASREAGLSADAIRNLKRAAKRGDALASLSMASLRKLAPVLQTSVEWLTGGASEAAAPAQPPPPPAMVNPTQGDLEPLAAFNLKAVQDAMPLNMPIFGTVAGSLAVRHQGAFEVEARVIGYVRRPPALLSVPDAYALYVSGSSMTPQYNPGDLVFVHPHKPARAGDPVVVQARYQEGGGVEAFLAHYARLTAEHVIVSKLSPTAEVRFDLRFVQAVHRVLTMNELFGV
ncbi:XRE family transcriptional regulator [Aurantimonas sp. MSK8Z-1]|uniref:S24 family peptidase n=1 Tax=Mangrovibrevibacter kandeliae TaxID=2968473 RepID=UPI00211821CB|nr:S24 family peptidase [Aurantimonas sp. MSK8Z-1]MCW4114772.1 XRE family transcriptional regulator [Aurantimonas sp. MSK8Z-1]